MINLYWLLNGLFITTPKRYYKAVKVFAANGSNEKAEHIDKYPLYPEKTEFSSAVFRDKNTAYLKEYGILKEKYGVEEIAGNGSSVEKALRIMEWLTENTYYNGGQPKSRILPDNPLNILEFSCGRSFKNAINCRYKAIILTDLLLAIGIKAYPLCLVGGKKIGCHFMVHAYSPELNKWVALDPSFNTHFKNEDGLILDILQLRKSLQNNGFPIICGYNFNGSRIQCFEQYKYGFVKEPLQFISTWEDNARDEDKMEIQHGVRRKAMHIILEPIEQNYLQYLQTRIKNKKFLNSLKQKPVGTDDFLHIIG